MVEHRRCRHLAAVRGVLEHRARRRRAVRPARRRHRHDRQRRQHAASGPAEDRRQHRPGRLRHRSCRRRRTSPAESRSTRARATAPSRRHRECRPCASRSSPPGPARTASSARRPRPSSARPTGRRWRLRHSPTASPSCGSSSRDVAGNESTSAMSTINVDNDAPVVTLGDPGAAVGSSVNLSCVVLRRHGRRHLPLPAGRHARDRHSDRLGRDGAVRPHLDDGARPPSSSGS